MTRRRGTSALVASPVLVGAVTVLVAMISVFLAYNANNGLPFVPTYDVKAEIPGGSNLVVGNEVRLGGFRVGVVDRILPGTASAGERARTWAGRRAAGDRGGRAEARQADRASCRWTRGCRSGPARRWG